MRALRRGGTSFKRSRSTSTSLDLIGFMLAAGRQSASQIGFSAVNILAFAALARVADLHTLARAVVPIALMAVVISALKQASVGALVVKSGATRLSQQDVSRLAAYAVAGGLSALSLSVVFIWPLDGRAALGVGVWLCGAASCDVLRSAAATYTSAYRSMAVAGTHVAGGVAVLSGPASPLLIGGSYGAVHLLAGALYWWCLRASTDPTGPAFLRSNRRFSALLGIEGSVFASLSSLLPLSLAVARPEVAVVFQIVNQTVATPAAYLVAGFTVPATQRMVARSRSGHPFGSVALAWWSSTVATILTVCLLATRTPVENIIAKLFGPQWTHASDVILPACSLVAILFSVNVLTTVLRIRKSSIRVTALAVSLSALVNFTYATFGVAFGVKGLEIACIVSATLVAVVGAAGSYVVLKPRKSELRE